MRARTAIVTLALLALPLAVHAQPLYLADVLEPLYPDSNATAKFGQRANLHLPLGAPADIHILIDTRPGESLTVGATLAGKQVPLRCWAQLADVPVEQNTGLDSRTEMFTKQRNPYVIRRAPFRILEVIRPLQDNSVTSKTRYTAFRLSIPPATLVGTGTKAIAITVKGKTWTRTGMVTAKVYRAALPGLRQSTFLYTNWFNLGQMEQRHAVQRWSRGWLAMLDRYAAFLAAGRQNCINIPGELITVRDGKITLDDERLFTFVDVFRKNGFIFFESPHLMRRSGNDDWSDPELTVSLTGQPYATVEGKRDVTTIVSLLDGFIKRHGLEGGWLQHISDEPGPPQARCYREVVQHVRSIAPGIRIMDATNDREGLAGSVDYWCPTIDDFQKNEQFFRTRERAGDRVLVYTCLIPGGPWLNRLLDQERLRQVYFGWGGALYSTAGYLHWGLNQFQVDDPLTQSVVHHPSPQATPENFLPAGDTHIIYPGPAGPLSSTRFEAHRIGVEDFELLRLLKLRDSATASRLIGKVFRSYTDYSTDVPTYRAVRKEMLEILSR
jgi:hypothetical protein